MSGFFFLVVSTILATIVSRSRSSLSSVMFVENYDHICPSLGNILNIVLIISGILGILIARKLCDKAKNEVTGLIVVLAAEIPFLTLCIMVGNIPVYGIVACLCVVAALESVSSLFRNYYNIHFVKFGKSGTAAGIINAGCSFSFMIAA